MKKLNEFGYTKVEVLIIVVLLGIVAFITINKTSYAFAIDNTGYTNEIKDLIELQAEDYAKDNLDIFKEMNTTYIDVDLLVEKGYLLGNDKGLVINPKDTSKNFNSNKIKLEYDEKKKQVKATFID